MKTFRVEFLRESKWHVEVDVEAETKEQAVEMVKSGSHEILDENETYLSTYDEKEFTAQEIK